MTRALALEEGRAAARTAVLNSLRHLREAVNDAERLALVDSVPRALPLALKVQSVEECCEMWQALREAHRKATDSER